MKKLLILSISALTIVSCAKEKFYEKSLSGGREVSFTAEFENDNDAEGKTFLNTDNTIVWNSNDPISIFDGSTPIMATAVCEDKSATAVFSASLSTEGPWYAIYPHNENASISGDVVTTEVLDSWTLEDNSFAKKVNVSIAKSSGSNTMFFKNVLSYIRFSVGQGGIYSVTLKGNNDESLAGTVQIKYNSGDLQTTVISNAKKSVTLLPSTGQDTLKTEVGCYIGFVPTNFTSGFTLVYTDVYGDTYEVKTTKALNAERSHIYNVGTPDSKIVIDSDIVFEDPDVESAVVAKFGTGGKLKKSRAAAVTYDEFKTLTFSDKSKVNKFNELKYFTGLSTYVDKRNAVCVPDSYFSGFTKLEEVTLPYNVTEIRPQCFYNCSSLKYLMGDSNVLPSKLTGIWSNCCCGCSSLDGDLIIPEGVTALSNQVFQSCAKLTSVSLPSTLKKLGVKCFYDCAELSGVINLQSATEVGEKCFYNTSTGMTKISRIVLSNKLKTVGQEAFWRICNATSVGPEGTEEGNVVIPGTLTDITAFAFCDEYRMQTLILNEGIKTIAKRAFRSFGKNNGNVISAYLPSTITSIADEAFVTSYFNYMVFAGTTPPNMTKKALLNSTHFTDGTLKLYVPASAVSTYKTKWGAELAPYVFSIEEKTTAPMEVKGNLVDVRTLAVGENVYPQNDDYTIGADMVTAAHGNLKYAVCLHQSQGPTQVRAIDAGKPLVAVAASSLDGWTATGESFSAGGATYYVFTQDSYTTGTWVDIPKSGNVSAIVFGESITVPDQKPEGYTITKADPLRDYSIGNVSIVVLPDGSYLACCTGSVYSKKIAMFKSTDKGQTWICGYGNFDSAKNLIENYPTLFLFQNKLYLMGVGSGRAGIRICCSEDGGVNWTVADSETTGIICSTTQYCTTNAFHTGPGTALVEHNGRLWAAWEEYEGGSTDYKFPFMLSCPTNADIMKKSNWTVTNVITTSGGLWEGNAVVYNNQVYNLIRQNNHYSSNTARLQIAMNNTTLMDAGSITMPGGGKKFKVIYDSDSQKYYALTNPSIYHTDETFPKHDGWYNTGCYCSLQRNKLSLLSSTDLRNWTTVKDDVFYNDDCFFHGYQYVDFVVDGDDLVCIMRHASPEERGLPARQHDANCLTFFKIENFRSL